MTTTILNIARELTRLAPLDFARAIYREILHRAPRDDEVLQVVNRLAGGQSKLFILSELFCSPEAEVVYLRPYEGRQDYHRQTIASIFKSYYLADEGAFVHFVYQQMLHRNPEQAGLDLHVRLLKEMGYTRAKLGSLILNSSECQGLVSRAWVQPDARPRRLSGVGMRASRIGFFLMYPFQATLEGEGIGMFTLRLSEGLLRIQSNVSLVIATTPENEEEVRRLYSRLPAQFLGRVFFRVTHSIDSLNRNADVDVWIVPYIGLSLAAFLERPYIVCLHDLVYHHFPDLYRVLNPLMLDATERVLYTVADGADAVVSQSEFVRTADAVDVLGLPYHKTAVIRLAAPSDEYDGFGFTSESIFRSAYHLHRPYLLYPSAIRLHKNHIRLLQAFIGFRQTSTGQAWAPDLVITDKLAGSLIEGELKQVLATCPTEDIRASIRFLGRLPSKDLPSLYKYAAGTIVPTLFEGSCPFPILESLSVQTPVAASDIPVTREIVTGKFLTFDPYSVSDMMSAMNALLEKGANILADERRTTSHVLKRTWKDAANEYYDLIQAVYTNH